MSKWVELEDNNIIKEKFRGYKEGLVYHNDGAEVNWVIQPPTANMIEKYKVNISLILQ